MITNSHKVRELEDSLARTEGPIPRDKALQLFTAMWEKAAHLGVIPFSDPLEGIESDIGMVRVLNACSRKSSVP